MDAREIVEETHMYCEHCGTQIPDGSIFCVACGKKQSGGAATEEVRQETVPPREPETAAPQAEPETAVPQAEAGVSEPTAEFDWSTFNPVPEEPAEPAKPDPEPQTPWQAPQQEPQTPWQGSTQQSAPGWQQNTQSGWQNTQQGVPGWQQNPQSGWQGTAPQSAPGWQQNPQSGWQGTAPQSAPGWQQNTQSGWQNTQQNAPGWQQNAPGWQQSAPGWQQPQQGQYGAASEERRQPTYRNGRIDYGCPMNWYKFQVYFNMIPTALIYLAFGVALMVMAGIEGDMGSSIEYYYRGFRSLLMDPRGMAVLYLPLFIPNPVVIGLACAVFGALMLVAWVKMIRLQSGGSTLFLVLAILPTVFFAVNLMIAYTQLSNYVPTQYLMEYMTTPLVSLGLCVLVYILQVVYFRKRAYLFVNH